MLVHANLCCDFSKERVLKASQAVREQDVRSAETRNVLDVHENFEYCATQQSGLIAAFKTSSE